MLKLGSLFHIKIGSGYYIALAYWDTLRQVKLVRKCVRRNKSILIESRLLIESCMFSAAVEDEISQVLMPAPLRASQGA